MPRPSNTASRRLQIVDALVRLLPGHGYAGATIAAIAKEAGLTPGLVHYHFASKQEILIELVAQLRTRIEERHAEFAGDTCTPGDDVDAFIDAHLAVTDNADLRSVGCWVAIASEAMRQEEVRRVFEEAVEEQAKTLRGLLSRAKEDGAGTVTDAGTVAGAGAVTGTVAGADADADAAVILSAIHGAYQLGTLTRVVPAGTAACNVKRLVRRLLCDHSNAPKGA